MSVPRKIVDILLEGPDTQPDPNELVGHSLKQWSYRFQLGTRHLHSESMTMFYLGDDHVFNAKRGSIPVVLDSFMHFLKYVQNRDPWRPGMDGWDWFMDVMKKHFDYWLLNRKTLREDQELPDPGEFLDDYMNADKAWADFKAEFGPPAHSGHDRALYIPGGDVFRLMVTLRASAPLQMLEIHRQINSAKQLAIGDKFLGGFYFRPFDALSVRSARAVLDYLRQECERLGRERVPLIKVDRALQKIGAKAVAIVGERNLQFGQDGPWTELG